MPINIEKRKQELAIKITRQLNNAIHDMEKAKEVNKRVCFSFAAIKSLDNLQKTITEVLQLYVE